MSSHTKACRKNHAPDERYSSLSAAILRINTSLDLETVLHDVVDSARALTGTRYGCIVTIDETGVPQNFITSGYTEEEHQHMVEWSEGPRLFKHICNLSEPLRLADFSTYIHSLGITGVPVPFGSFQGTPMRHHGVHVGNFYLCDKEGELEFTDEDEEVLLLFASQAAVAVANARTYREEQRVRAGLEALIEISPVGVVVFNARTGRPVSFNCEARRIVEVLCTPGHSPEELLKVMTCRFTDGREIVLDQFVLADAISCAKKIRTEEIILSTPDGRNVTTLINATPICSENGSVESVVVTMQDLTPLEELDRMRTAFLSMVSHELRTPLAAIKGSTTTVLDTSQNFASVETQQFFRIIDEQANRMSRLIGDLLDVGRLDTGTLSVTLEPTEVSVLVEQARTTFLSGDFRHTVHINLPLDLPQIMADRGRIVQVLNNLLSNATRHSPESLPIQVTAAREGIHIAISVSDEGQGMAPEQLEHLFRKYPGVAGSDRKSGREGSGLGLAICKGLVEAHGGRIRAESAGPGQGMQFTFTVPVAENMSVDASSVVRNRPTALHKSEERTRILVVDDDPLTLHYVRDTLINAGYAPLVTGEHHELPNILKKEKPALVLLDLILPGTDGIELMETTPELTDLPVIFISGYGRDETIARALEAGADDYIVKPFSPTELTARIRAVLRRHTEPAPFKLGELAIDFNLRHVSVAGRTVELTVTEYALLHVLSVNAGRVSTYDILLRKVWGGRGYGNPKLVRAFIKKLREKLGDDPSQPTYIFNVRGVGYRMKRSGEV